MTKERKLNEFGKAVTHCLVDRNMQISDLAKKLEVTTRHINPYFFGTKPLTVTVVNEVIKALDLNDIEERSIIDAAYGCMNVLEIRTSTLSGKQKDLAILIARQVYSMSELTAQDGIDAIKQAKALSELVKAGEKMGEYKT